MSTHRAQVPHTALEMGRHVEVEGSGLALMEGRISAGILGKDSWEWLKGKLLVVS